MIYFHNKKVNKELKLIFSMNNFKTKIKFL